MKFEQNWKEKVFVKAFAAEFLIKFKSKFLLQCWGYRILVWVPLVPLAIFALKYASEVKYCKCEAF